MNKINKKFILLFGAMLLLFSSITFGQQEFGQLNGTVRDQNDAVVAGATVKITNTRTGVERTTTTDSDGFYIFTSVFPGDYDVKVTASGFGDSATKAQVTVGGAATANIKLGVAALVNVVDVPGTGGLAEVNTSDQTQSTVVTSRQLTSLPVLDRDPYSLVGLSGNVSTADPSGRGAGVAVNGQRSASTNILLDGTENAATFTQTIAQTVPQEAVSEFRVTTSNFSSELGRASGGVVNVLTKSGGNRFEGSVFAQNRNSRFASNGYDNNANGNPKPFFNRNQFGYGFSGPIKKNELFFSNFGEWTRVRSTASILAWVPTPQFISAAAANTQAFFSTLGTLAATPTGVTFAVPSAPAGCGVAPVNNCVFRQVRYTAPVDAGGGDPQNSWNNVARVDWNWTDKTTMFFSYKAQSNKLLDGTRANSPWAGYTSGLEILNQNFQASGTHSFSSNLLFDGKISYRRSDSKPSLGSKSPNTPTLYLFDQALPRINGDCVAFPGYLPCSPGSGLDIAELEQLWDFKPNMTYIVGKHNFRFGGQYVHLNDAAVFGAYQNASEGLSGASLTQAVTNFLSGTTVRHQVAVNPQGQFPGGTVNLPVSGPNFKRTNVYNEWAAFVNDSWRIGSGFTLNLGLRYEYYGPQKSKEGLDSNFYFGSGSTIFERIRNGSAKVASTQGGLWKADKNNWAPRLGFAWDVTGDGKNSVRGGYGLAFERNFGNVTFNVIQNPPYYAVLSVPGTVTTNNFGPLAGSSGTATLPRSSLRAVDPDIVNAYAHQWGVSYERQLGQSTVAKIDYSGSAGRRLYSIANINRTGTGTYYLGTIATTGCNGLAATNRLNCQYSNINFRGSDGTSNYYSFTPSLESNNLLGTGMIITARYTYSSAKDNLSSTFSESANNFNLGYVDPFNPMLDYGYADFDIRHRFISSVIYPIPLKLENKAANAVLGGWNVSSIITVRSGSPFTIFDVTSCNVTTCYRMINGGRIAFNGASAVQSGTNLFDYITITGAPTASDILGNNEVGPYPNAMSKRNAFRAPGFWNVSASVYKDINVTEKYKLQLRMDTFNIFNHANTFVDGGGAFVFDDGSGAGAVGTINTQKFGTRNVQFNIRFFF